MCASSIMLLYPSTCCVASTMCASSMMLLFPSCAYHHPIYPICCVASIVPICCVASTMWPCVQVQRCYYTTPPPPCCVASTMCVSSRMSVFHHGRLRAVVQCTARRWPHGFGQSTNCRVVRIWDFLVSLQTNGISIKKSGSHYCYGETECCGKSQLELKVIKPQIRGPETTWFFEPQMEQVSKMILLSFTLSPTLPKTMKETYVLSKAVYCVKAVI